ncbi:MAG: S-methyl-5-thioribose-1-phosphate isomerase [Deltaproteobacteria bacterium]|nr:S-methyl-5-thioribose-1-phosphate isomerase [Deltaproteobacteria bacterium]
MSERPSSFETVCWRDGAVVMLDQRLLPEIERYNTYEDAHGVAHAIRTMVIRGAPAIGVAAALGVALAATRTSGDARAVARAANDACDLLAATRPTAVNLFWALDRMRRRLSSSTSNDAVALRQALLAEALAIREEDIAMCRRMGSHGAALVPDGATILTHCNAGGLATAGHGTALGVVRSAVEQGKRVRVLADETRPLLQGARLTAWELARDGIPVTVIVDGAAASHLARGEIDMVVVGADRVAANGDFANKIGTLGVALAAAAHGVPFYVAAPWSTVDLATPDGAAIPIEERAADEVTHIHGRRVTPEGVPVRNPAFDVTPARLVTALITDRGLAQPPNAETIGRLAEGATP